MIRDEADELEYWFELCNTSAHYPNANELSKDLKEIKLLLNKIIGSSKKKLKANNY